MKDLKPAASDLADEVSEETESKANGSDYSYAEDLGNDLSPEETKISQSASAAVSETVSVINELICAIMGFLKQENKDDYDKFVDSREKLLKFCQGIGAQIDELGACLYHPQEIPVMKAASDKISSLTNQMQVELESRKSTSEDFLEACTNLRNALRLLDSEIHSSDGTELVPKLENLNVNN